MALPSSLNTLIRPSPKFPIRIASSKPAEPAFGGRRETPGRIEHAARGEPESRCPRVLKMSTYPFPGPDSSSWLSGPFVWHMSRNNLPPIFAMLNGANPAGYLDR